MLRAERKNIAALDTLAVSLMDDCELSCDNLYEGGGGGGVVFPRPARVLIITEMRFGFNYLIAVSGDPGGRGWTIGCHSPGPRMVRLGPGCEACEADPRDDLGCQPVRSASQQQ